MEEILSTLAAAVHTDPRGLRPGQLVQQFASRCLHAITANDEDALASLAERCAATAREMRPPDVESVDLWRAWYAGQVHAIAALIRVYLRQEVPASVRRRILMENNAAILMAFDGDEELTQTELRERTGIHDPSQFSKHIAGLRSARVLDVAKEGRNSWVRLTALGRRILAMPNLRRKLDDKVRSSAAVAEVSSVEPERLTAQPAAPPGSMVGSPEDDTLRILLRRPTPTGVALTVVATKQPKIAKARKPMQTATTRRD